MSGEAQLSVCYAYYGNKKAEANTNYLKSTKIVDTFGVHTYLMVHLHRSETLTHQQVSLH